MATRNQIENHADLTDLFDQDKKVSVAATGQGQVVHIDREVSPAVLAGLLGVNVAMVYQYRQDGKLPASPTATYRQCITHHIAYWKKRTAAKSSSMAEALTQSQIALSQAKTEQTWMQIKKDRGELVDVKQLAELFEPAFVRIRSQLVVLARRHPDLQREFDNLLASWEDLGKRTLQKGKEEFDAYIQQQIEAEIELGSVEDLEL